MTEKWIDLMWKTVLVEGFDDALLFFMPELAKARDNSRATILTTEELPAIGAENDRDARISDLSFSVPVKGGGERRVAFVIEQQHTSDRDFALRMFEEFYRMADRMRIPVTSLAIFTGQVKEVDRYDYSCFGTELSFKYNSYSVAKADVEALRHDDRVFAVVVLAAALMLKAGGDPSNREKYARELLRLMRERDYTVSRKKLLLTFVGRAFRVRHDDMSQELKEEWNMLSIPLEEAVERLKVQTAFEEGKEEGWEKGKKEGKLEIAKKMLAYGIDFDAVVKASGLPEDALRSQIQP